MDPRRRYLDLLVGVLTRHLFVDEEHHDVDLAEWPGDRDGLLEVLRTNGWRLTRRGGAADRRVDGRDWPPGAETMVGRARLDNTLEGWFHDTLPSAPVETLSLLRLDGDLYESTIDALDALYPKLAPCGYCIVDDYTSWDSCRAAVDDYRRAHGIADDIVEVDWSGVYWRRSS